MDIRSLTLVYYSPTGTTRRLLHALSQGLESPTLEEIDLTSPASRQRDEIAPAGDLVVIGSPVYEERIPPVLVQALSMLHGHDQAAVVVATYGNVGTGIALQQLARACNVASLHVIAGASFVGEHSFCHDELPIATGRPDDADLGAARAFGARIRERLGSIVDPKQHQPPALPSKLPLIARLLPQGSAAGFAALPDPDEAACVHCGACVAACPSGAIDPDTLLVNERRCTRCFACARACQYGARSIRLKHAWLVRRVLGRAVATRREPRLFM